MFRRSRYKRKFFTWLKRDSVNNPEDNCLFSSEVFSDLKTFMAKSKFVEEASVQFMIDVPETWLIGADGSIMEVFNKLESVDCG